MIRATLWASIATVLLCSCQASEESPRQLRVVTSGGFAAAFDMLGPQFAEQENIELVTERGASSGGAPSSIPIRLERGERFDVVILAGYSLESLIADGYVRPESRTDLVRSRIGMVVREGAALPDISTPANFLDVLQSAESFGYSASASGTYLSTELLPELGLWDSLKAKGTRVVGERVGAVVARGGVEIGFQQISELLPIPGVTFVGPIPEEFQKVTTFSTGITTDAKNPGDAARLIEYLASIDAAPVITATGLDPVVSESP